MWDVADVCVFVGKFVALRFVDFCLFGRPRKNLMSGATGRKVWHLFNWNFWGSGLTRGGQVSWRVHRSPLSPSVSTALEGNL